MRCSSRTSSAAPAVRCRRTVQDQRRRGRRWLGPGRSCRFWRARFRLACRPARHCPGSAAAAPRGRRCRGRGSQPFLPGVVDEPIQLDGFLVVRDAAGITLVYQNAGEVLKADGKRADAIASIVVELVRRGGQGGGGPVPVPGEALMLEAGGGVSVPAVFGDPYRYSVIRLWWSSVPGRGRSVTGSTRAEVRSVRGTGDRATTG